MDGFTVRFNTLRVSGVRTEIPTNELTELFPNWAGVAEREGACRFVL